MKPKKQFVLAVLTHWRSRKSLAFVLAVFAALSFATAAQEPAKQRAKEILEATGIKGGLIIHLGCSDGRLTSALRANDSYLVRGLDTDVANVAKAREHIHAQGCYGPVCVDKFDGEHLPYSDGIVNLIIAENPARVTMDEITRVLAPQGVAYIQKDGKPVLSRVEGWTKLRKPWPARLDQWTHYRYDSTGNAVAKDTVVGPPRRMQWVGSPRWARSHEHSASLNALVSANGRIFYIIDEGPRASIQLPAKFVLAARDAFSGVVLWKRPLSEWFNHLFPLKSGPARLTRRLIAVDDEVYTTLGINEPLKSRRP